MISPLSDHVGNSSGLRSIVKGTLRISDGYLVDVSEGWPLEPGNTNEILTDKLKIKESKKRAARKERDLLPAENIFPTLYTERVT